MGLFDFQKAKTIKCEECGAVVSMRSPSQRFCTACARAREREVKRENQRRRRLIEKAQQKAGVLKPIKPSQENRNACNGCAHDSSVAGCRCCDYKVHQVDYHLPRRQHPVPMAQECLFYSSRPWDAGRLTAEQIEHIKSSSGRPLVNTLTGAVARDCNEAAEMDGRTATMIRVLAKRPRKSTAEVAEWRFFTDEEMELLSFVGVKRRPAVNKTAAWK